MIKMLLAVALFTAFLFVGCAKSDAIDVNSFPTECLKNCASGFNGCVSLSKSPEAKKQCDNYFTRCKNECEAKDKPAAAPAPTPAPVEPAPAAAPAPAPAPATK
jgi:major membrane immunogen (membrane-anchored lipoprotein)